LEIWILCEVHPWWKKFDVRPELTQETRITSSIHFLPAPRNPRISHSIASLYRNYGMSKFKTIEGDDEVQGDRRGMTGSREKEISREPLLKWTECRELQVFTRCLPHPIRLVRLNRENTEIKRLDTDRSSTVLILPRETIYHCTPSRKYELFRMSHAGGTSVGRSCYDEVRCIESLIAFDVFLFRKCYTVVHTSDPCIKSAHCFKGISCCCVNSLTFPGTFLMNIICDDAE
jgi:hypothetical protein